MKFNYKARTKTGEVKSGSLEASSRKEALNILKGYDIYVTDLEKTGGGIWSMEIPFLDRVKTKDVVAFTRQFAVMLNSGISSAKALRSQISQIESTKLRNQIASISNAVEAGSKLSQAFSIYPDTFSPFYISVIKSGEATGEMADSLDYLADHLEREYNLKQEIRGAMTYPAFVIIILVAVLFLVSFFIIPKLSDILKDFSGDLPVTTQTILAITGFVREGGWILIAGILVLLFFIPQLVKGSSKSKEWFDRLLLKLPIAGQLQQEIYLTRFSENLSVLLNSGLSINESLDITKDVIGNSVYKNIIDKIKRKVTKGGKISEVLQNYPKKFPPFLVQMISTGEQTGKLESTLMRAVDFYRDKVKRKTSNLSDIIEPVLIIILGLGVGVLAVGIFIPLFNIGMKGPTGLLWITLI